MAGTYLLLWALTPLKQVSIRCAEFLTVSPVARFAIGIAPLFSAAGLIPALAEFPGVFSSHSGQASDLCSE